MKYFALLILTTVGCAHMEYETMYYADTAGTYKCDPSVQSKAFGIELMKNMNISEFEKHSGYGGCKNTLNTEDTVILECKTPNPYKRVASTKMAPCHKFLTDNKD